MQARNKNDVLLTELVIVILVFSLVAVTVVQMFVAARHKSAHSGQVESALIVAQDWAERLSGSEDFNGLLKDAGFTLAVDAVDSTFVLERVGSGLIVEALVGPGTDTKAGRTLSATVKVFGSAGYEAEEKDPLVALPVLRYIPLEEVRP